MWLKEFLKPDKKRNLKLKLIVFGTIIGLIFGIVIGFTFFTFEFTWDSYAFLKEGKVDLYTFSFTVSFPIFLSAVSLIMRKLKLFSNIWINIELRFIFLSSLYLAYMMGINTGLILPSFYRAWLDPRLYPGGPIVYFFLGYIGLIFFGLLFGTPLFLTLSFQRGPHIFNLFPIISLTTSYLITEGMERRILFTLLWTYLLYAASSLFSFYRWG